MTVTPEELNLALNSLWLNDKRVLAHASLRGVGPIEGGAEALLSVLLSTTGGLMMPAFTYRTMVTPASGPPNNGMTYGSDRDQNLMAEPFDARMPVDPLMGVLAETLRQHPTAKRTQHPILSFTGSRCDDELMTQTMEEPLAPIGALADEDGWVLLIGVDQTANTAIHYGERLAGRRAFVRWALTKERIVECPGFPGDSTGFRSIAPDLEEFSRVAQVGEARVQAMPLKKLLEKVTARLRRNSLALLCNRPDCERCRAIEAAHDAG